MSNPKNRVTALNLRAVPTDLKSSFKAYCAGRGYSMEEACEALIRDTVERHRCLTRQVNVVRQKREKRTQRGR